MQSEKCISNKRQTGASFCPASFCGVLVFLLHPVEYFCCQQPPPHTQFFKRTFIHAHNAHTLLLLQTQPTHTHTPTNTHSLLTHNLVIHYFVTHLFHTQLFHTQDCHIQLFRTHKSLTQIFHAQLCHLRTQLCHTSHNFVTRTVTPWSFCAVCCRPSHHQCHQACHQSPSSRPALCVTKHGICLHRRVLCVTGGTLSH